jgi:hypothetical protein
VFYILLATILILYIKQAVYKTGGIGPETK